MKNLSKKERTWVICLLLFFAIALIVGIKSVYAYYVSDAVPGKTMFAAYVGDFYVAKGDISVNVYKKVSTDASLNNVYRRENAIPASGTISSVSCKLATYNGSEPTDTGSPITCEKDGSGACSYTYANGKITLKSSQPVRCKFYFN